MWSINSFSMAFRNSSLSGCFKASCVCMVSGSVVAIKASCKCSVTNASGCGSLSRKMSGCERCCKLSSEEGGEKVDRNDMMAVQVKRSGAQMIRPNLVMALSLVDAEMFRCSLTSSVVILDGAVSSFEGSVGSQGWMKLGGKLGFSFDGSLRCCSGRKD